MKTPDPECDPNALYWGRFTEVVKYPFVADRPIRLRDHDVDTSRRCRFCRLGKPDVSFHNVAHAVPEFLGNRSLLSMNECDECNKLLKKCEDHLGIWSLNARALSQVKGKHGRPTYKNSDLRVESGPSGLHVHLPDPTLKSQLEAQRGPFDLTLLMDGSLHPYVPIRAAKALVKIACSICPPQELDQFQPAIEWLMGRSKLNLSMFPVLYAFTPGLIRTEAGEVILLRRTTEDPIPYLWGIVSFANHRLQFFVPFCTADSTWPQPGKPVRVECPHYPSQFGADWPFGQTEYGMLDWSGTEAVRDSPTATLRLVPRSHFETSGFT